MRNYILLLSVSFLALSACETDVDVTLPSADPVLVVDAWLTHEADTQTIRINYTQPYFDASPYLGVENALVEVISEDQEFIPFSEVEPGVYQWLPANPTDTFGIIGKGYGLNIEVDGVTFYAITSMKRVPEIDSIAFRFETGNSFFPDAYFGEVWARDLPGSGDTYWIKAWKNGIYLNEPGDINIAYDAGFSPGGNADSLIFIRPIRDGVNSFEDDDNDEPLSPYVLGDSLYVEIHAISNEAWFFLANVAEQTSRSGGFGELFATPLANVYSNLKSSDGTLVVGMFNMGAVSRKGRRLKEGGYRIIPD